MLIVIEWCIVYLINCFYCEHGVGAYASFSLYSFFNVIFIASKMAMTSDENNKEYLGRTACFSVSPFVVIANSTISLFRDPSIHSRV